MDNLKRLFKILLWIVCVFSLLIVGFVSYLYFNKEQIKSFAISQLNNQLNAEITTGEIDISFFKTFPNVGLDLRNFHLSEPGKKSSTLLSSEHLYIGFNIKEIIRKTYNIQLLVFDSAVLNLKIFENGDDNFSIVKENKNDSTENSTIKLKEVRAKNLKLIYNDKQDKQYYNTTFTNLLLSGNFSADVFDLSCDADVFVHELNSDKLVLIKDKNIKLNTVLEIDTKKEMYEIRSCKLLLDDLNLKVSGGIFGKGKATLYNLDFKAEELSIQSLISLLPIKIPEQIKEYKSKGNIFFNGFIKGESSEIKDPQIRFDFGVTNGELKNEKLNVRLEELSFTGKFDNGNLHTLQSSILKLENISTILGSEKITGNIVVNNFSKPKLDLVLQGKVNLDDLFKLFPNETIDDAEGYLTFDTNIHADLNNQNKTETWNDARNYGFFNILIDELSFKKYDRRINNLEADFVLKGSDLNIIKCAIKIDKSDIYLSGDLKNMLGYLFIENELLEADISYKSNFVDLQNVVFVPKADKDKKNETTQNNIPLNVKLNLNVNVKQIVYYDFKATDFTSQIQVLPMKAIVKDAKMNCVNGKINLNINVLNTEQGNFFVTATSQLNNVNITELFRQTRNFGIQELTYKNLKGTLNGTVDFAAVWDKNLVCNQDKIYSFLELKITNGELIDFKPLEAMSRFVKLDDLHNIKFADLSNTIEIKNRTILIPEMEMKNNALNITLKGSQNFDFYCDYKIKLKVSELLKKKRKSIDNQFGEEDEKTKGMNYFITMKGPIDNLKFAYDMASVKEKISQEIKTERENIKEIFKKEFGSKKEENLNNKEKKKSDDEIEFEPE